jgi:hypothetical protein
MATLWTFGDSFTAGAGCVDNEPLINGGYNYYNVYKKPDSDIWPNILGKTIGYTVKNIGKSGASNDYILDSIIDNFYMIEPNDIVIIGKTFHQRFDVPRLNSDEFHTQWAEELHLQSIDLKQNKYQKDRIEIETILNYSILFSDHKLFKERQDKRFDFIKTLLNDKTYKILIWDVLDVVNGKIETIRQHTKGEIKDYHLSFNGHKLFSEFLYKKLYGKPELI